MTGRRPVAAREARLSPRVAPRRSLRIFDQETARVVAVHHRSGTIVGAGCLVDSWHVITCSHVVKAALKGRRDRLDRQVFVTLPGVEGQPTIVSNAVMSNDDAPENDIALLVFQQELDVAVRPVEFASPLRHGGKAFSVMGFPGGDPQGRNAAGILHAADARGLVQMDRGSSLLVLGGFSGAPVWSSDVGGFVGLVVTELADSGVAWCIPSRILCQFHPELLVRFRVPPADRPQIHDYELDDPNVQTYGAVSNDGNRRLTAKVEKNNDDNDEGDFKATAVYECPPGSSQALGGYVTFITHPSYTNEHEDAYELFSRLQVVPGRPGLLRASAEFYPEESFTLAAVGDGGDTALTFNLSKAKNKPKKFK